ncbi:MAG: hypothetical protein M1305_00625 [Candidatus Marsarchaeota archaeon]|nr:hypothetical protein [Candidatus Marsarchaeota archaeon]
MNDFGKVLACLKGLGMRTPSVDNFEDKLIIQKAVYLLQLKGVKTGFGFNLYVRGPYSPALTTELYSHKRELRGLETTTKLSEREAEIVQELRGLTGLKPSLLEVAATYAYFAIDQGKDPLTATKGVRAIKGFYPEAQIALGISHAKKFLFKPTEADIAEMKKEHEALEQASLHDLASSDQ